VRGTAVLELAVHLTSMSAPDLLLVDFCALELRAQDWLLCFRHLRTLISALCISLQGTIWCTEAMCRDLLWKEALWTVSVLVTATCCRRLLYTVHCILYSAQCTHILCVHHYCRQAPCTALLWEKTWHPLALSSEYMYIEFFFIFKTADLLPPAILYSGGGDTLLKTG
jgi:hypothetical protein